jgi:ferredoxin-NADP reductase
MNPKIVKIISIQHITHDVLLIKTEKPEHYDFTPGQATEVSINKKGWQDEKRPFTFTCVPENAYLEFTIKTYPSHKGVTSELLQLKPNDELILHDVFGAIAYKSEGVFIAGGAGVTPFIAIIRYLLSINIRYLLSINKIGDNKLIFANKTRDDIIHEEEFKNILGKNFINILTDEKSNGYAHGQITASILKTHINDSPKNVYLCGPPPMMDAIEKFLSNLHVDKKSIVKESF